MRNQRHRGAEEATGRCRRSPAVAAVSLCLLLATTAPAQTPGTNGKPPQKLLDQAMRAYSFSRYDQAIALLTKLLYPERFNRSDPEEAMALKTRHTGSPHFPASS